MAQTRSACRINTWSSVTVHRLPGSGTNTLPDAPPGARLKVLEGANHACLLDETDRFHELLREFVTGFYGVPEAG